MSTALVTPEDYKFFDFLAPYQWPDLNKKEIKLLRDQVKNGIIQIETLLENALVNASKGQYTRVAEVSRDFCDGSDAKKAISQFRNNDIARDHWSNSFAITNLKNKRGVIRSVCYSKEQKEFYFFSIPYKAYKGRTRVEVSLDTSVGYRVPKGIPHGKWTRYQLTSFERLATITPAEVDRL
jgi:hypothetical protein